MAKFAARVGAENKADGAKGIWQCPIYMLLRGSWTRLGRWAAICVAVTGVWGFSTGWGQGAAAGAGSASVPAPNVDPSTIIRLGRLLEASAGATGGAEPGAGLLAPSAQPSAGRVVVVANAKDPDSEPLARYYMAKRGIPEKNLVIIDAPTTADVTWAEFVDKIFNPLRARLTKDGWFSAYVTGQRDSEGRLQYVFYGNQIDFLVLCYGIPIRIMNDPARLAATPLTLEHKELNTNQAAVDGELSLMGTLNSPTTGLVANPLFGNMNPDGHTRGLVVKVARLDGPSPAAVRGLIDSALAGEARGLQGRAYVDMGGPHPEGEDWLKGASATLRRLGFDVSEDHEGSLFTWKTRFDAPAFYFGWYSEHPTGPIAEANFHFPPGAIGIHIHSFSGDNIRKADARWVGPLVVRGVAATVGNVFEPYLHFTHHLDLFMEALAHDQTTGEAAYCALPALSWQEIFVGDPLYRPFAVSLKDQLAQAARAPGPESSYAVMRQMNLLQAQNRAMEALAFGEMRFNQQPTVALAFALAQLEQSLDRAEYAHNFLTWAAAPGPVARGEEGVLAEFARWAHEHNERATALELWARALGAPVAGREFLTAVLPEAITLAKDAGNGDLQDAWQKQWDGLNPAK